MTTGKFAVAFSAALSALFLASAASAAPGDTDALPFYEAGGYRLPPIEAPSPPPSVDYIVAPELRILNVMVPAADSTASDIRIGLYLGFPAFGITLGYSSFAGEPGFALGTSFLRFADAIPLFEASDWQGSFLLPDVNVTAQIIDAGPDPLAGVSLTTDLVGFRIARCLGPAASFHADLRAPTLGPAMYFVDDEQFTTSKEPLGAFVYGATVDVGFLF